MRYSTHGYTLVSKILETIAKEKFSIASVRIFDELGMKKTFLDDAEKIIEGRAS